jgi:phosphoglucosamine mutase
MIPGANLKGLRIVLDCANGAAYKLGPELFGSLGANVIALGDAPDGRNINANCGSLYLEGLQQRVVAERAQLGVAFDGDADRALFVSDSGRIVNGDGILLAVARYLKMLNQLPGNRVVATSMSNLGLERILVREGITLARTNVGDRYVLEEMLNSGSALGGEQSGHIIFLNDSPAGDGLLTALKVACLVSFCGRLEHLVAGFKDYPQIIVNVKVRAKPPLESLPEVARALSEAESALGENGRIVLRYSGTEWSRLSKTPMCNGTANPSRRRFSSPLVLNRFTSFGSRFRPFAFGQPLTCCEEYRYSEFALRNTCTSVSQRL